MSTYEVVVNTLGAEMLEVDTSKILFVVGGAFVGINDIIKKRKNSAGSIGFGAKVLASEDDDINVRENVSRRYD